MLSFHVFLRFEPLLMTIEVIEFHRNRIKRKREKRPWDVNLKNIHISQTVWTFTKKIKCHDLATSLRPTESHEHFILVMMMRTLVFLECVTWLLLLYLFIKNIFSKKLKWSFLLWKIVITTIIFCTSRSQVAEKKKIKCLCNDNPQ